MIRSGFAKRISLYLMSLLYLTAGISHLISPKFYIDIMPPWLSWHRELVFISGICEICLGLLLIFVPTRRLAAWGIIGLLVAVFPANIQMMLNYANEDNSDLWLSIVRLPFQILLIWWAYGFTKPITSNTRE